MSKIQKIFIQDFKAINSLEVDFKGCTAILTGGNNKGKSSFLQGIPNRIRFVRPEVMVKEGSTQGKGEMTLDSGERFVWEFNTEGVDKLTYFTKEGAKRNVTTELGAKFFPKPFDIDKFLNSTPKEQSRQLQKILGLDFTDIDSRYADAYQLRKDKNQESEKFHVKLSEMMECPKVDFVDMAHLQAQKDAERTRLNKLYTENKKANDEARAAYTEACRKEDVSIAEKNTKLKDSYIESCRAIDKDCESFNNFQVNLEMRIRHSKTALKSLIEYGYNSGDVGEFILSLESKVKEMRSSEKEYPNEPTYETAKYPKQPDYIAEMPDDKELKYIDDQILAATQTNQQAQDYKNYIEYRDKVNAAKTEAEDANELVVRIEQERLSMIQSAPFPVGIAITPDGLTVDGLPLDRNQLSSSRITIAALQIASINLGEVKTLFFDASYLDRNSLAQVNEWANENDYQLLIERPDFDGGEIKYELIEKQ